MFENVTARGRSQDLRHSFSQYGPPSRWITYTNSLTGYESQEKLKMSVNNRKPITQVTMYFGSSYQPVQNLFDCVITDFIRFHLYLAWPWWPSKWFTLYNSLVVSYGWKLVWLVCFLVPIQTTWCSPESLPFVLLAWSKCVLCILGGNPNECWLHTCDACVITTWRLGLRATKGARN